MDGMTAAEIAGKLGITSRAAKMRLVRAGAVPIGYAGGGPTALYDPSVVDLIRTVAGRGRPKKTG
jgi:predicted ArsR family transcriptional regulator